MKRIDDVLNEINHFIDRQVLENFIAYGLVCPVRDETDFVFDDLDVARIRLVCDLHVDMNIELDNVEIILSLMNQLYETRGRLGRILKALENQPEEVKKAILENLQQ